MYNSLPEVKSCSIGEFSIEYLHYPSDGPDMIMLHATGFLPWLWHPVARSLSGLFNIIIPHFCNHRYIEPEDGGLGWNIIADDLYKFCSILNLTSPCAIGHSMGATVITLCAGKHKIEPAGIILMEPIFLPEISYCTKITVEQHPLASRSINRRSEWENRDEARLYLKNKKLFSRWDEEVLDLYLEHGMTADDNGRLTLTCSPRREASLFMGGNSMNPWPLLGDFKCPVLVIEGETSENRLYIDLKKAASLIPGGIYHEVKGAGHLIPMEQPQITADIIRDFFLRNKNRL